jgi:hypothetical protein
MNLGDFVLLLPAPMLGLCVALLGYAQRRRWDR